MRAPTPVPDPGAVLAVYERHRAVHPYGIYDAVRLWDVTTWWVAGDAVVGLLDLPGSPVPVVYAVSATAEAATLDLLAALAPSLPPRFVITGPVGVTARLAPRWRATWSAPHVKMHLADPAGLPADPPGVVVLDRRDLADVERLFRVDPHAGAFFHPGLLDTGWYVGVRDAHGADGANGAALVAVAGVHVADVELGLAALGNVATHPARRRRGLARAVVTALCHRLLPRIELIGLNVAEANTAARALYAGLGFVPVARYEEAQLVAVGQGADAEP